MKKSLMMLFGVLLLLRPQAGFSTQQDEISQALERLQSKAPGRVDAEWNRERTKIKTLRGQLSPASLASPEEIAKRLLSDYSDLLQMRSDISDLQVKHVQESLAGYHVQFQQTYNSLLVLNGGVEVHIGTNGQVLLMHNYYVSRIDISLHPIVSEAEAADIALDDYLKAYRFPIDKKGKVKSYSGEGVILKETINPELGIFEHRGIPHLVYRFEIFAESPFGLVEYIVDAHSGAILRKRSLIQNSRFTGTGQVFDPNPVNTLNDTTLQDNNDADSPDFAGAYGIVSLPGISRLFRDRFGPFILRGPFVEIDDSLEQPVNPPVRSRTGDFLFKRNQQAFEGVMVYFNIDRNQRYIQSLGFNNVNNRRISVDPHGLGGADNSHYVASPLGAGYLAFGEGGVDDAEDADVILHEYGHAIQDNQTLGKYLFEGEAGAQGEGFGDYWAFTNGPTTGFDPACFAEWDTEGDCLRRLDRTVDPNDGDCGHVDEIGKSVACTNDIHDVGQIWSSALRDLFLALGKTITDTLVIQSHFLVPDNPTFSDGAQALLDSDDQLYDGAYRDIICDTISNRGIDAPGCTPSVTAVIVHVHNPEGVEIASIEGMNPSSVEIYDGDTLIGYGAHNAETHNKPIQMDPGNHTIKVKFNGMTLEQNISIAEGQTQVLTFAFNRTEYDLEELIRANSIPNQWTSVSISFPVYDNFNDPQLCMKTAVFNHANWAISERKRL